MMRTRVLLILLLAALGTIAWLLSDRVWLAAALLVAAVGLPWLYLAWSFHRAIPRAVTLTRVPADDVCPALKALAVELEDLGFMPVELPQYYNSMPRAQLLILRAAEDAFASILRVRVLGVRKLHLSILSPFADSPGHLETTSTGELESMRAPDDIRMQVFPGATPDVLLQHHRAALSVLQGNGRRFVLPAAPELQREAIFTLAGTGAYLRRNSFRLACSVFRYAWDGRSRNPPVTRP